MLPGHYDYAEMLWVGRGGEEESVFVRMTISTLILED